MLGFVKMSAISALLSFGVVTFYDQAAPPAAETSSGKLYPDRLPSDLQDDRTIRAPSPQPLAANVRAGHQGALKGDRLPNSGSGCERQTWPYYAANCTTRDDGRPNPPRVRVITVESRDGNVSVLQRTPQSAVAQR
jgi:hypothetical protein